ncbi:MAG TPA: hypothetical protein VIK01_21480 [Polyangiaceae bacterium]
MADIYLDACCFIYLVEGQPEWRAVVEQRLRNLEPTSKLITSQLARLECRTKPMRHGNRALLEPYQAILVGAAASHVPLELVHQLDLGGRLVISIGNPQAQLLERLHKRQGALDSETLGVCHLRMLADAKHSPSSVPGA